jgi:hypothetical protein
MYTEFSPVLKFLYMDKTSNIPSPTLMVIFADVNRSRMALVV